MKHFTRERYLAMQDFSDEAMEAADYLQAGEAHEEILRQYPSLQAEEITAAIGYAAWLAHEEEEHPLHTEITA